MAQVVGRVAQWVRDLVATMGSQHTEGALTAEESVAAEAMVEVPMAEVKEAGVYMAEKRVDSVGRRREFQPA